MGFFGASLDRRAVANNGLAGDQGRAIAGLGLLERGSDRLWIVAVDASRNPTGSLEALHLIDRVGKRERPIDRDAVVIEQHDELIKPEMAGQRDRLLRDAFHQVAIGSEHERTVIDQFRAEHRGEMALGNRHAHCIPESLPQRSGGRLHAGCDEALGMTRRNRAQLAEALDLLDRHPFVTEEMEQRVNQHRAVTRRQDETVAVGPGGIGRIELEIARKEHRRDIRRAHW